MDNHNHNQDQQPKPESTEAPKPQPETKAPAPTSIPASAPAPGPASGPSHPTDGLDAEIKNELAQAMADLDKLADQGHAHDPNEIDAAKKAAAATSKGRKGPRVVHAGREHRTGVIVSVGPKDLFVEFGPKELGVVESSQWKEGEELPKVGEQLEVTVDRYESNEGLYICSRPGAVKKILRHKMIEDSRKAVAAHARRFAVGLGLTDEQIRKDLPKIVFDTLALDIDKDPEDFLAKTYAVQQKNRLIEDERFDVEKYQ
ncbi:MAG: hypothetical protein COB69_07455, partial [Phycisphaera sp.]